MHRFASVGLGAALRGACDQGPTSAEAAAARTTSPPSPTSTMA